MSIKDALKPFEKRLTAEALIRSAVLAGMIAACVAMALGIVHVIIPWLVTELEIILSFAGVFAVGTGFLYLILYRPTKRDTAKRLDSLGMSERVETMLEFEHSMSPAANLQREDTITRLQGIKSKDIRLRISKTLSALCAVFFVCATVLLFLPEVNAFSRYPLINRLNEMVDHSDISDELKEELRDIIDELEDKLDQSEDGQGSDEDYEAAKDQINESVDQAVSKDEIGEAMQDYEDLRELGEAIQNGDKEGVSSALDKLEEEMTANPDKQQSVAEQLQNALEQSGVSSDDDLREALENMQNGLQNPDQPLEETMDKAESEISSALDQQQGAESLGEQMKEQLENAKPSASGGEGEQGNGGQSGEGQEGNAGNGNQGGDSGGNQSGGSSSEDNMGSGGTGAGNGNGSTGMKDQVVDPEAGQVSFGSVYAAYVAEFLAQAEEGELPDSVVEAMNEYLENLKNGNEKGE